MHPDGKRFYFANSWLNQIVGYDLASDGNLSNRHVAVQLPNDTVDGIMFDEYDRLWVARWANGTVDVVNVDKGEVRRCEWLQCVQWQRQCRPLWCDGRLREWLQFGQCDTFLVLLVEQLESVSMSCRRCTCVLRWRPR